MNMQLEANLSCIFGSVLLMMLIFSPAMGNPTTPLPWADPCGDSLSAVTENPWGIVPTPSPVPISETLMVLRNLAARVKDSTQHMMSLYVSKRFMDPSYPENLEGFYLAGMPNVITSAENIAFYSSKPVSQSLVEAYHNLSLAAVHMEQVRLDEITKEHGELKTEVETIENKLYSLMCNIDVELRQQQVTLGRYVTRDVMSVEYRDIADIAQRRNRDYIILRDTKKVAYFHEVLFTDLGNK